MKTNTHIKILELIDTKGQVTPKEIASTLNISSVAVFKQLAKLLQNNSIEKIGSSPLVFYRKKPQEEVKNELTIENYLEKEDSIFEKDKRLEQIIEENFFYLNPSGKIILGKRGFLFWCIDRKYNFEKFAIKYEEIFKDYTSYFHNGTINATKKLKETFKEDTQLNHLFYLDFYSIPTFGKTRLGSLLLYSKQSQDLDLIHQVVNSVKDRIGKFIQENNIEAVAFIPPTIRRNVQFMKELEGALTPYLFHKQIFRMAKVSGEVIIPQKTLKSMDDRIQNAKHTIFSKAGLLTDVDLNPQNILIIDDAVGSAATMNETARKLRENYLVGGKIIGLALVGSMNGFDVINEV